MRADTDRIRGGLYGLLIGDAVGVPYEFHAPAEIPPIDRIDMTPPAGYHRAHAAVPTGTWSDDGAQALCLLDSLLTVGHFDLDDFSDRLLRWYRDGLWAVGGVVFDVGIQTAEALSALCGGMRPEHCGNLRPEGKGNGALMRVLPLALWHRGTDAELIADAHAQCLITHAHLTNQVCCALYCLTASVLLRGKPFAAARAEAVQTLQALYAHAPAYRAELELLQPDETAFWRGEGSGFVADSLRSAFMVLQEAFSYEDAVKRAIALGNDTDTTACITGGLAGILFGYEDIPQRWLDALRQKEDAEAMLARLCAEAV